MIFIIWAAGEPVQKRRQHILTDMIEEIRHRIQPFPASAATGYDHVFIGEVAEVVAANLGL
jgi:hypothetical protein